MSCCSVPVSDLNEVQPVTGKAPIDHIFLNTLKSDISKCIFDANSLSFNINHYVVVLKCGCDILVGIDKQSMQNFVKIVSRAVDEMCIFIASGKLEQHYTSCIERWLSSFSYYDQVLWSAVIDAHVDRKDIQRCCNSIIKNESEILTKRKVLVSNIKTILCRILTLDRFTRS